MSKKQIVMLVVFIVLVSIFRNCDFELPFMKDPHFSDVAIGETFSGSRDGHCLKVADNYCLAVDLGSVTILGKIPDEYLNEDWTDNYVYRNAILKARYIKAYFNDTHLVLCEEKLDYSLAYLSFEFSSEKVIFYETEEEVLNAFGFESTQWRSLCNTYAQSAAVGGKYPDSYIDTVWVSENPECVMSVDSYGSAKIVIIVDNEQSELAVIFRGHEMYVYPSDIELGKLERTDCLLIGEGIYSSDKFIIAIIYEDKLFDFKYEELSFKRQKT